MVYGIVCRSNCTVIIQVFLFTFVPFSRVFHVFKRIQEYICLGELHRKGSIFDRLRAVEPRLATQLSRQAAPPPPQHLTHHTLAECRHRFDLFNRDGVAWSKNITHNLEGLSKEGILSEGWIFRLRLSKYDSRVWEESNECSSGASGGISSLAWKGP
ncbi:hypothetical protein C8F04DRAFT_1060110 [Mycena alexandri]|uniref:Uncharacterized protein n=1 Tax=Mycena alexandri TaxID=1745969 RepID=A0AAD6XK10_9AGAR|nr:hypothetical protein C8F04DRAFT_1060110 [Mycena alexandri]